MTPFFHSRRARLLGTLPLLLSLLAAQTGCGASAKAASAPPVAQSSYAQAGYPASAPGMATPGTESVSAAPAAPMSSPAASPASKAVLGSPAPGAPTTPAAAHAKNAGPTSRAPVIIYQGDLRMMADEDAIPKTIDKVIDVAESFGGHLAGRKDQSVQIKVPSASFREAMTKIESIGGVTGRSVTADDVSEEFHDLEVRLGNLRATRTRLQEFLTRATGIQDMLTVERELERVATEIDRIEGRLEFLRTRAAMSVIAVSLSPKPKVAAPIVVAQPSQPPRRPTVDLPIPWVSEVGIDPLLSLRK
jgi:hypothetical protein